MSKEIGISPVIERLLNRGVVIPNPCSVEIDPSLDVERIAPGVVIHTGSRITGAKTSIGPGCELGREAPVAVENCQLGHDVELSGGFFSGATFLDGASMGSGAHVRPGTLVEEQAGGAHSVGLKQTIFLSFVTAGSLINFCDALMAGGTSRKNHSEIGSSYIHFNFTPHQDKATPSLFGDVPRGVFLDQPAIFLGGQGGLVGPVRIAYGTVIPAGMICRRDVLDERKLVFPEQPAGEDRPFASGVYGPIDRIVRNNLIFIGNLRALRAWYRDVRVRTMSADAFGRACHEGALARLDEGLGERIKRLRELAAKMPLSIARAREDTGQELPPAIRRQQETLAERWPEMEEKLKAGAAPETGRESRDVFLNEFEGMGGNSDHLKTVESFSPSARAAGTEWLRAVVDSAVSLWTRM